MTPNGIGKNDMKIITISHTKGGVGKSTIAWHLAHAFARTGPVELIDLDFNQILHYVNIMADVPFMVHQPRSIAELDSVLASIAQDTTIIIDVGGFDSLVNQHAIRRSDHVVIPVAPDSVTEILGFRTFDAILDRIDRTGKLHVLFNNVHSSTRNFDTFRSRIHDSRFNILGTVIRNRKIYRSTMGDGKSVFSSIGNVAAQQEMEALRDELGQN